MPLWLKSKALIWANPERAPSRHSSSYICMQEGGTTEEEDPLYYQVPLSRIISWNRWWYITARALLIAYQRRFWGSVGNYLQDVAGVPLARLAGTRRSWGVGRGRLFRHLSDYAPK